MTKTKAKTKPVRRTALGAGAALTRPVASGRRATDRHERPVDKTIQLRPSG